jgi:hypothetical protein
LKKSSTIPLKKFSLNKLISNLIASNGNEANDGVNEWQQFKRMA